MMNFQWFAVSMTLIVLLLVHVDASKYRSVRQVGSHCPPVNLCDYVQCENGQCVENKTSADCFTCVCSAGFTGQLCEISTSTSGGCASPCQNGGQCQEATPNVFTCACPADYTGAQCETFLTSTHPCVTNPGSVCRNGGTCTINGAGYLCNCPTGWSGASCEVPETITTCAANTCGAHGTCVQAILPNNTPTIVCQCEAQWTGKFCDTNLAGTCSTGFCQNGGVCTMNGNVPTCTCPSTYTGQQCETLINPLTTGVQTTMTTPGMFTTTTTAGPTTGRCTSNSCSNGGSCFNTGNNFICLCTAQFTGPTCSVPSSQTTAAPTTPSNINACSPNPCNNGGQCYKHGNSFVCVCKVQYSGATCDVAKTTIAPSLTTPSTAVTCATQPCQNGGVCYNAGNSYFCYCGAGSTYTGKNCETSVVAADPNCPLNCSPGYCVPSGNAAIPHACMCNGVLTPTSCSSK